MDIEDSLTQAYEQLNTKTDISDVFCSFVNTLEQIPATLETPELKAKIQLLFRDVNKRIDEYDEQYQVLVNELGTICSQDQETKEQSVKFFHALLDLCKLAYSVYQDSPESLQPFATIVQQLNTLFSKGKMTLSSDSLETLLLITLSKSAWAYTKSQEDMKVYAKQMGGKRKNKTRKQRRV